MPTAWGSHRRRGGPGLQQGLATLPSTLSWTQSCWRRRQGAPPPPPALTSSCPASRPPVPPTSLEQAAAPARIPAPGAHGRVHAAPRGPGSPRGRRRETGSPRGRRRETGSPRGRRRETGCPRGRRRGTTPTTPQGRAQPGVCAERGAGHRRARGTRRAGAAPRRDSRRPHRHRRSRLTPVRLSITGKNQTRPTPLPEMTSAPARPGPQPKPRAYELCAVPRPSRPAPGPPAAPQTPIPGPHLALRQPSCRPAPPAESSAIPAVSRLRAIRVPSAIFVSAPEGARPRRTSGVDSDPRPRPVQPVRQRSGTFVLEEAESRGSSVFGLGRVRLRSAPPRTDSAPTRGGGERSLRRKVLWARCVGGRRDSAPQSATPLRGTAGGAGRLGAE
ncbi:serine/arginine repetitive matrix protein 1-like [Mustela lutreola]|uniref:serine/arginine repetitive matrix protein 1-like n=1 Tax=Mustela lutreola TaxID=9666 RepID=UPI002796FB89|nr:serine/arginine repetitive matrix protein 1-like [Mustela lutreola]